MKLIAVTQRVENVGKFNETRDALDQRWSIFLYACGLVPLILPNCLVQAKQLLDSVEVSGILLTGGNETADRDQVEIYLLELAIEKKLSLLGVCHGMQVIQRYFGVELVKVSGHVCEEQEIVIHGESRLVNSYHKYGSKNSSVSLIPWAVAYDGVVKAVRHVELPIVGMMWHPERYRNLSTSDVSFFVNFFGNSE